MFNLELLLTGGEHIYFHSFRKGVIFREQGEISRLTSCGELYEKQFKKHLTKKRIVSYAYCVKQRERKKMNNREIEAITAVIDSKNPSSENVNIFLEAIKDIFVRDLVIFDSAFVGDFGETANTIKDPKEIGEGMFANSLREIEDIKERIANLEVIAEESNSLEALSLTAYLLWMIEEYDRAGKLAEKALLINENYSLAELVAEAVEYKLPGLISDKNR